MPFRASIVGPPDAPRPGGGWLRGPVKRTAQPQRLIHPTADHASSCQLNSANAGGALVRFLSTYDQREIEHKITNLYGPRSISGGRSFASCGLRLSLLPTRTNVGISRQLPVYELVLGFSVWHRCILRYQSEGGVRTARTSTLSRTSTLLGPASAGACERENARKPPARAWQLRLGRSSLGRLILSVLRRSIASGRTEWRRLPAQVMIEFPPPASCP
jgi:hypothetical protein